MDNLQWTYQPVSALKSNYGGFRIRVIQWSVTVIIMFVLVGIILVGIVFIRRTVTENQQDYKQDNKLSKRKIGNRWRSVVGRDFEGVAGALRDMGVGGSEGEKRRGVEETGGRPDVGDTCVLQ
jgi:hypothetical protein